MNTPLRMIRIALEQDTVFEQELASLEAQMVICLQFRRPGFSLWVGKIPSRKELIPTPVSLPEEFHAQKSLVGYSLWGPKKMDTTEQLTFWASQVTQ